MPVLATLFYLSYAKLLRSILVALQFTVLETPDSQRIVWSFDGNIRYLGLKHGILFVIAAVFLLTMWLPLTFVLLVFRYLKRYSHYCLLRWVNKFKPLFDSYVGPLKVNYYYWIGLGLLARLLLLLTSVIAMTTIPLIAVVIISFSAFILGMLVLNVYRQWQLSVLEACYLFNMVMFSSGVLFVKAQGGSKDTLACISLGFAFSLFLVIIGYHMWRRIRSLKKLRKSTYNGCKDHDNIQVQLQDVPPSQPVTYQVISVPELREPILTSPPE